MVVGIDNWGVIPKNEDTKRDSLTDLLYMLEMRLLDPEIRRSPTSVEALLTEDFLEIGASGQVFNRAEIVAELRHETPFFWRVSDFAARALAPDLYMITYRLRITVGPAQIEKKSIRTSIWKRSDQAWRMTFHQGTAVPESS